MEFIPYSWHIFLQGIGQEEMGKFLLQSDSEYALDLRLREYDKSHFHTSLRRLLARLPDEAATIESSDEFALLVCNRNVVRNERL